MPPIGQRLRNRSRRLAATLLWRARGQPATVRHVDSHLALDRLATAYPPYRPTYRFGAQHIDAAHARLGATAMQGDIIDLGIPGWLRPADALKLYELAYFSDGDVLEIGCYHGLSTRIQTDALRNAGRGRTLTSLELMADHVAEAERHTADNAAFREFIIGDARESCAALRHHGRTFGTAFVDHSHTYELVHAACEDLKHLLNPGGFALFHDYNDDRNAHDPEYGVFQAARDAFADGSFTFHGIYGCTGLYQRT
jgi:predicted O-methyltransferase YrrM